MQIMRGLIIGILIITGTSASLQAQETVPELSKPSWYFGLASSVNFNFYDGSTSQLATGLMPPVVFHKGAGTGLFLAPSIEFHKPDAKFGFMIQAGVDSRKSSFNQVNTDCNCSADLSTDLGYISIEPSLHFTPTNGNFYLYGGLRFAFNQTKTFTYPQGANPDFPNQVAPAHAKVIIHGYTDVIGEVDYNQKLSVKRAKDVESTLKNSMINLGTTGVTFKVNGLGENEKTAPFENILPEERAYNRTVIIDIITDRI
jgi:hypothetical protein